MDSNHMSDEHMRDQQQKDLVITCMKEVCIHAGFTHPEEMVQRDMDYLSESIESKTNVLISLSTIKRLIHGQFSRLPQIATLNAISQYLGYHNWQDYKWSKRTDPLPVWKADDVGVLQDKPKSIIQIPTGKARTYFFGFLLVTGALLVMSTLLRFTQKSVIHFDKASFSFEKTTLNEIPNTVLFKYNIDEVRADSFFIQQSWDKDRRTKIHPGTYMITDIYYEPGYHIAKLIANDIIIKTLDVSIPTDRWMFYGRERDQPHAIKHVYLDTMYSGSLFVSKEQALSSDLAVHKDLDYFITYNPSDIVYSADHVVFQCRARSHPVKNHPCPYLLFEIYGQKSTSYFISKPKGCAHEISTHFNDLEQSGKTTDLSALATDVYTWQDIEIKIDNKQVRILINQKSVFHTSYKESNGLITGFGLISDGLPEIDHIQLTTLDGHIIYQHDFHGNNLLKNPGSMN